MKSFARYLEVKQQELGWGLMKILKRFWELSCFQKIGDELIASYSLEGVSAKDIREWFNEDDDAFLGGDIPVKTEQVAYLQPFVADIIDLDNYDYFVGEFAVYDWNSDEDAQS